VLGTLVNTILNDPGPLEDRLSGCLLLLLEAGMKPSGPGKRKK
jgi:hypothetical protein